MMNKKRVHNAFTLVELIMVIVIIGLLAAVVVPKFTDVRTQAQSAAEDGTVAAVKSGIQLSHMGELAKGNDTWPTTLDSASNGVGSTTNPLFANVIDGGVSDKNWRKTGTLRYTYTPTSSVYVYTRTTGQFTKQ